MGAGPIGASTLERILAMKSRFYASGRTRLLCPLPEENLPKVGGSGAPGALGSFAARIVPVDLKKGPVIGDGSQSREEVFGKVSRFAAGLCVVIHTWTGDFFEMRLADRMSAREGGLSSVASARLAGGFSIMTDSERCFPSKVRPAGCCMKSSPRVQIGRLVGILLTVQRDRSSYPSRGAYRRVYNERRIRFLQFPRCDRCWPRPAWLWLGRSRS
jgi:hypothetical protein